MPNGCGFIFGSNQTVCPTVTTIQTTENVVTTATEFVERSTTGPCQVGNSDRVGTAEGIATDEILTTTTQTFLITTQRTTTQVFNGFGRVGTPVTTVKDVELSRVLADTQVTEEIVDTTFVVTGKCKNVSGPQKASSA